MKRMLLTGANRGVGRGLVDALLRQGQYSLVLATRNRERQEELRLSLQPGACSFIHADQEGESFAREMESALRRQGGQFDTVFLNAGAALKGAQIAASERAEKLLQVNFRAVAELTDRILSSSLLAPEARIILVSSELGNFRMLRNAQVKKRLIDAAHITELLEVGSDYVAALKRGENWQSRIANAPEYSFSKLLLTLAARIFARDARARELRTTVFALCPGWTRTDMGGPNATQSVDESLPPLLRLVDTTCALPIDANGKLFSQGRFSDVTEGYS